MTLLHTLSYVGAAAAFIFVTLSLASGLLWLSELIEEHSRTAKVIGQRGIYIVIILHVLLYFFDSLPVQQTLFSIVCHIVYLQNITGSWPFISLTSLPFTASCILVVIDHFVWFFHFAHLTQQARQRTRSMYYTPGSAKAPGFADIATFFGVCVWLAPLFLFLSLSANDNALPMNLGVNSVPSTPTAAAAARPPMIKPRGSLFKAVFGVFSSDTFKSIRPRARRADSTQGILAPPSPNLRPIPSPLPSPNPSQHRFPSGTHIPPPPSPNMRKASFETPRRVSAGYLSPEPVTWSQSQPTEGFALGTPPRRMSGGTMDTPTPIRRATGGSGRVELRRVVSTSGTPTEDS